MAVVTISYDAGGSLAVIEFDATLSETHIGTSIVTEHPVEKGVNISDHVRPDVDRLTLEVMVTNAPIKVPGSNLDGATGGVAPLELTIPTTTELPIAIPGVGAALKGAGLLNGTTTVKANVLQFEAFDRVSSVYHELKTLQETATIITIGTSLREYTNFVFKTVTEPRQAGDGDSMKIQIEAQQIRFALAKTVAAPKSPVAAKKVNRGPKPTTEVQPKTSLALKAAQGLGLAK